jgi:hypothetical protein
VPNPARHRGAASKLRRLAVISVRPVCSTNEQKRLCTYCSHALVFCEAFRAEIKQSIILTVEEQNHSTVRAAVRRAELGAENVNESDSYIGDNLYVPAEGPFCNS